MFNQMLEEKKLQINELYDQFVGFGLNSHLPGPNTVGLWREEIQRLMWAHSESPDGNSVVIGSHNGGSEIALGLSKLISKVISVDINYGEFYTLNTKRLKSKICCDTLPLKTNSSDFRRVYLEAAPDNLDIGFAFLDGFHSYRQTLVDFEQIKDFLAPGAIVGFHDCSPKFPKKGSVLPDNFKEVPGFEDFYIDEAISKILEDNPGFEEYNVPIGLDINYSRITGRPSWIRGATSSFNSLFFLRRHA